MALNGHIAHSVGGIKPNEHTWKDVTTLEIVKTSIGIGLTDSVF